MKITDYKRKLIFNTYLSGFIGFIIFVLSVVTIYSNFSTEKKLTYKSKAAECDDGSWSQECLNPKERQSCASDAGVEQVWLCEGGQWVYKYPQCAVRCAPDAPPPPPSGSPECIGKSPGTTLKDCIRKGCDTNIKKYVCTEVYCDNNSNVQEKPGRVTEEVCGIEQATCNKGAVIEYCTRQECDQVSGYFVCVETYWNDSCGVSERMGTKTATKCVENEPPPTGAPVIAWPTSKPQGGESSIVINAPTAVPLTTAPQNQQTVYVCLRKGFFELGGKCYNCVNAGDPLNNEVNCILYQAFGVEFETLEKCPRQGFFSDGDRCYFCYVARVDPQYYLKCDEAEQRQICSRAGFFHTIDNQCYNCSEAWAKPAYIDCQAFASASEALLLSQESSSQLVPESQTSEPTCSELGWDVGLYEYKNKCYSCESRDAPIKEVDCFIYKAFGGEFESLDECQTSGPHMVGDQCYICDAPKAKPRYVDCLGFASVGLIPNPFIQNSLLESSPQPPPEPGYTCEYKSQNECKIECTSPFRCLSPDGSSDCFNCIDYEKVYKEYKAQVCNYTALSDCQKECISPDKCETPYDFSDCYFCVSNEQLVKENEKAVNQAQLEYKRELKDSLTIEQDITVQTCNYSSARDCRMDCASPSQCWTVSSTCFNCKTSQEVTALIAQNQALKTDTNFGESCSQENNCCGPLSICTGSGLFGWGEKRCKKCAIESEVCNQGKCERQGCSESGKIAIMNGKCYACFKPYNDPDNNKLGEFIVLRDDVCQDKLANNNGKIGAGELVTTAASSEDQYHLRQEAFNKYTHNPNIGTGSKIVADIMRFGDGLGHVWGSVAADLSKAAGDITGNKIGNSKTEATSSFGNYYVSNMEANAEFEKANPGQKRTVSLGQGLAGGVAGGLDFANKMSFGVINRITSVGTGRGLITRADQGLMNLAFGKEGEENYERKAAEAARAAGIDVTNTVMLVVPVAKGIGGIGTAIKIGGTKLAVSSSRPLAIAGKGIQFTGKAVSTAGKVIEWTSPERWAAPILKSAPIETGLEVLGNKVLSSRVGKIVTNIADKAPPSIAKAASSVKNAGSKVVDIMIPRSALTYTPEEAARFFARDLKLGLADDAAAAAKRLSSKYNVNFSSKVTEVDDFIATLDFKNTPKIGEVETSVFVGDLTNELKKRAIIKNVGDDVVANVRSKVKAEDSAGIDEFANKYKGTTDKTDLALAINKDIIKRRTNAPTKIEEVISDLTTARAYAEEVISLRAQSSLTNRAKTVLTNIGEEVKTKLSGSNKKTALQKVPDNQDNLFFNGISKEEVAAALDPKTQEILAKLVRENPDVPVVISKVDIPGHEGVKQLGPGQRIVIKEGGSLETIGLKAESKWRGFEDVGGQKSAEAIVVYVDPESGIIPRDITALHEYGHIVKGHGTVEAEDRIREFTNKYFDETKSFNSERISRELKARDTIQELEAEIVAVKQVGNSSTNNVRPGLGSYKLQRLVDDWRVILKQEGLSEKQIQTSIDEILNGSGVKADIRAPSIIERTFGFSRSRNQVIQEVGQKTNLTDAELNKLLWEKGVPFSSINQERALLKGELSNKVAQTAQPVVQTAQQAVRPEPVVGLRPGSGRIQPIPKDFSTVDRIVGTPGRIEKQVITDLRGMKAADVTDDVIKSKLVASGYASNEVDSAISRVKANLSRKPVVPAWQMRQMEIKASELYRRNSSISVENQLRAWGYPEDQIALGVKNVQRKLLPNIRTPKVDVKKYANNTSTSVAEAPYRIGASGPEAIGQDAVSARNTGFFRAQGSESKYIDALVISADGHSVQGTSYGHVASQVAVEKFTPIFEANSARIVAVTGKANPQLALERTIAQLDEEVTRYAGKQGGTTFTAGVRAGDKLYIAQLGDSRLYLLRDGKLQRLTNIHSWPGGQKYNIRVSKSLGDKEIREFASGFGPEGMKDAAQYAVPDIGVVSIKKGDVILGGSDALEKMAKQMGGEDQLNKFLTGVIQNNPPDQVAQIIVNHAKTLKVSDDMSAAVYRVQSLN